MAASALACQPGKLSILTTSLSIMPLSFDLSSQSPDGLPYSSHK
jgi:hypothetical protein